MMLWLNLPQHINGSTYPDVIHDKNKLSHIAIRIVIHIMLLKWKFIYHVLSCHTNSLTTNMALDGDVRAKLN